MPDQYCLTPKQSIYKSVIMDLLFLQKNGESVSNNDGMSLTSMVIPKTNTRDEMTPLDCAVVNYNTKIITHCMTKHKDKFSGTIINKALGHANFLPVKDQIEKGEKSKIIAA